MIVILSGTSSAGKTSIMKEFPKDYNRVSMDDIYEKYGSELWICQAKPLKNRYYSSIEKFNFYMDCFYSRLNKEIKSTKDNVIDIVDDFINHHPASNLYFTKYKRDFKSVLVYTSLENLVRNIIKRKSSEPRGKFVFNQFVDYYQVVNIKEEKKSEINPKNIYLDYVNYNNFVKSLRKIKYEFESENELLNFANSIFNKLGIKRIIKNKNYPIIPRSNIYDVVLITTNKTPEELKNIIFDFLHM